MIFIEKVYERELMRTQEFLINQGCQILDVVIVYNSHFNGYSYFIKYKKA